MKPLKLSFLLILIGSVLLLSGASESAEESKSINPPIAQNDKPKAQDNSEIRKRQPPQVVKTPAESMIVKALRALGDEEKARDEERKADDKRWWPPSATWAIVYVTIVYVIVAIFQWAAINEQAITTRELAYLEMPWINVKPIPVDPLNWPFTQTTGAIPPFLITVKWHAKNMGRSPAFLTNLSINFKPVPYPVANEIPQYDLFAEFSEMLIGPNGDSHDSEWPLEINQADLQGIMNHQMCIGFYGFAEYYDTLRKEKCVSRFFCYWHIQNSSLPWRLSYEPVGPHKTVEYT